MQKEIERRFLVNEIHIALSDVKSVQNIIQGYISEAPLIRVRYSRDNSELTVKGKKTGITCDEFNMRITDHEALELLNKCNTKLYKTRYTLDCNNKEWVIDVFIKDHEGLIIAEVELESETEAIELPKWVGLEISTNPKYSNINLSKLPLKFIE